MAIAKQKCTKANSCAIFKRHIPVSFFLFILRGKLYSLESWSSISVLCLPAGWLDVKMVVNPVDFVSCTTTLEFA